MSRRERWFRWKDGTGISASNLSLLLRRPVDRRFAEQIHGKDEITRAKNWIRDGLLEDGPRRTPEEERELALGRKL
jgi:hypothetical protein